MTSENYDFLEEKNSFLKIYQITIQNVRVYKKTT